MELTSVLTLAAGGGGCGSNVAARVQRTGARWVAGVRGGAGRRRREWGRTSRVQWGRSHKRPGRPTRREGSISRACERSSVLQPKNTRFWAAMDRYGNWEGNVPGERSMCREGNLSWAVRL